VDDQRTYFYIILPFTFCQLSSLGFRHEELFGRFAVFLRRLVNEAPGKLASVLSGGEAAWLWKMPII
jgi:hypothetical protein